jgi:putative membrane protein
MAIKGKESATIPDSTQLALERTHLAHERTLMAWVRTATSLISFGFTIYKFFQYMQEQGQVQPVRRLLGPPQFAQLMISIGVISLLLATLQNWHSRKKMREIYPEVPYSLATALAALISILGVLAFIAVIFRE